MVISNLEKRFANDLINYVISHISGTHEFFQRFPYENKPSRLIVAGTLLPSYIKSDSTNEEYDKIETNSSISVDEFVEGDETDSKTDETENETNSEYEDSLDVEKKTDRDKKSIVKNKSLSVIFLIDKGAVGKLNIIPSFRIFYRVYPSYQEQKDSFDQLNSKRETESITSDEFFDLVKIWRRIEFEGNPIEIDIKNDSKKEFLVDLSGIISKIEENGDFLEPHRDMNKCQPKWFISNDYKNSQEFDSFINDLKGNRSTDEAPLTFPWKVSVIFERDSFDKINDIVTLRLLNSAEIDTKLIMNLVNDPTIFDATLSATADGFDLREFEYKSFYEARVEINKNFLRTTNCQAIYNRDTKEIRTTNFGRFEQLRINPRTDFNGIKAEFKSLSGSNAIQKLELIKDAYEKWINVKKTDSRYSTEKIFIFAVNHCEENLARFVDGLKVLRENALALKAFQLMQKTFVEGASYPVWRLFQLFFIVMSIPSIVDHSKREKADVLHAQTGSGKSEAYFGIAIFTLFFDRLRGKEIGVTGFTKFPLRMLSVQQLQRIATLIARAERIRKTEKIGKNSFSLGYFIGQSKDFPSNNEDIVKKIEEAQENGRALIGKIIQKCPFCSSQVDLKYKKENNTVIHKCSNSSCGEIFYLYFTSDEIYRMLPSFIISTVDKLAVLAWNRQAKMLFGGRLSVCSSGHGYVPINDRCRVDKECDVSLVPINPNTPSSAPTLMIQDEMHLVGEGFGTINAHIESFIDCIVKRFSGNSLKYIAMTATTTGAKHHIDQLYQRDIHIFPGENPGEKGVEDFFFDRNILEGKPEIHHIIIGIKPNNRDNQFAALLTLRYLTAFIYDCWQNKSDFATRYGVPESSIEDLLKAYHSYLGYFLKKADVQSIFHYLESVVNQKPLLKNAQLIPETLTGDDSMDKIREVIQNIEGSGAPFASNGFPNILFATSIVSHGVDIEAWNFMIFQGMPRRTAEYIQSMSRVGRKHLGVIFLWFYPNRIRDLSFYQYFEDYHRILERKVEQVPLSRWATLGLKQTFTTIFCAAILNYFSDVYEGPLYKVAEINDYFNPDKNPTHRDDLIAFIREAYHTLNPESSAEKFYFDEIPGETIERLNQLMNYTGSAQKKNFFVNALADCNNPYFKTQTGMRGIQNIIRLKLGTDFIEFPKKYRK